MRLPEFVRREIAFNYLEEVAEKHVREYPQLACMSFDRIGLHLFVDGQYDRLILERLLPLIGEGVVLDVGASIGNHSIAFSSVAPVIAFEPQPTNFRLLQMNIEGRDITAHNVAASDKTGLAKAGFPATNLGGLSIGHGSDTVQTVRIDDLVRDKVAFIKIDVEGHEPAVIRGALETIRRDRPPIVIEQLEDEIRDGTSEAFDLLKPLYPYFYTLDVETEWRVPQSIPRLLRKPLRVIEAMVSEPRRVCRLIPVERLEQRDYPALLAISRPLVTSQSARESSGGPEVHSAE